MNFAIKNMSVVVPFTVAMIGLASPANAFVAPDRSTNASETASVRTNDSSAPNAATKVASAKVCISLPALTGSRMASVKCRTKAEWENLGYELGDKK